VKLTIKRDISDEVRAPTLLAGWPGMGSVGVGAINYMRQTLELEPFAEVDSSEHFTPDAVVVKDGLTEFPDIPSNTFYYHRESDLIIFESEAQLSGEGGIGLMRIILDLAESLRVATVYTAAAFAMTASHKEPARVFAVANRKELINVLSLHGLEILPEGHVTGLNGLLLGFAGLRGIEGGCLLATIPNYAYQLPNPKASRELIRAFNKILEIEIALENINEAVGQMNRTMTEIEDRIRSTFLNADRFDDEEEIEDLDDEQVPQYVMEKIEDLFREVRVRRSRNKAAQLKEELDRWDLYTHYEDRFLDLFR
jgi:proteasome assembly chaperone (PAC2) family protein